MPNSHSWCFTVQCENDDAVEQALLHLSLVHEAHSDSYIIAGREVAPTTGQIHLQCFVRFTSRLSFAAVRELLPQCHLSRARGTAQQNFVYCSKDGDFTEYGDLPNDQGKRTDWERFTDWCRSLDHIPTDLEFIDAFPSLFGRYRASCRCIANELCPRPSLRDGVLRPWQASLYQRLQGPADDRTVEFLVDIDGGLGKSWFCGYVFSRIKYCQLLGPGKRDDLAHIVDVRTTVFLFNVPRGQMEYLNYGLLEMLKDRMVLSPKYESQMKILNEVPHVIVFCNEAPDESKMSQDRYKYIEG